MENICPHCGNPAAVDFDFCPVCGQKLADRISSLSAPPVAETIHPWRRYWARAIDAAVYATPLMLFSQWAQHDPAAYAFLYGADTFPWRAYLLYGFLFLLIQLLLEPWLLHLTGTTLGKRLLRIQITNEAPQPSYRQYLKRTALLSLYGYGLNIPILNLICMWRSKRHLTAGKRTPWDEKTQIRLVFHEIVQLDVYLYLICAYIGISIQGLLISGFCVLVLGWPDTPPPFIPEMDRMSVVFLILSMIFQSAIAIFISICIYKDARQRGRSSIACLLWSGASLPLFFFTVPLWLLTRPKSIAAESARQEFSWRTGCGCGLGCGCGCLSVILGLSLLLGGVFAFNASTQSPEKGSLAVYDLLLRWMPNNPTLYAQRGEMHAAQGNDTQAIDDFSAAIALTQTLIAQHSSQVQPGQTPWPLVRLYRNRGWLHDQTENYPAAIEDFSQAIALDPGDPLLYNDRGCTYINALQYRSAVEDFTTAIRLDPSFADAYDNRGWAYELLLEDELADADYQKAELLR